MNPDINTILETYPEPSPDIKQDIKLDIDFDAASLEWNKNKKRKTNGTYLYLCKYKTEILECNVPRMLNTKNHKDYKFSIYSDYCKKHDKIDKRKKIKSKSLKKTKT